MEEFFQKIRHNSAVILLLLTGAVFLFLKFLAPLLSPIILAMLFLTIFGPLLQKLQKRGIYRQVGAVLLLIFATSILAGVLVLLARWAWKGLPELMTQAEGWKQKLPGWAYGWVDQSLSELQKNALGIEREVLSGAVKYAGRFAALGGYLITFLITVTLLAKDYDELMNRLLEREDCHLLLTVICGVIRYVATYIKAQGMIMTVIACLSAVVLTILGISQGIFLGVLAGVLDALPFVGTGVVLVPLALVQCLEGKLGVAAGCLILYVICIFLRELLEPRLIGKHIGVRPVLVLISLYVGIKLFGVTGIIKGPLGFMIMWVTWQNLEKYVEMTKNKQNI
ncbi:MAG: AI-2E family transporter [Lachnospiraceae bacterium]|nr:AI-2E family transporter [Lachnospiraceae bacterium]